MLPSHACYPTLFLWHGVARVTEYSNKQVLQRQARQREILNFLTISGKHLTTLNLRCLLGSVKHICTYSGDLLSFSIRQDSRAQPAAGHHSDFRSFSNTFSHKYMKIFIIVLTIYPSNRIQTRSQCTLSHIVKVSKDYPNSNSHIHQRNIGKDSEFHCH